MTGGGERLGRADGAWGVSGRPPGTRVGNLSAPIRLQNAGPVADNGVACPLGQVTDNLRLDRGPGTGPWECD